jgi:predicted hydrocarbon binding protein
MPQYEPFDDGVEARGQTILSVVDAFPSALQGRAEAILAEHGIEDIDPDMWYPQENYLGSLEEIDDSMGTNTLNQIGKTIPKNAEWPPSVDTAFDAVESIDEAYQMNHRGGEIGYYSADKTDDKTIEVTCSNPYPCAFDRGLLEGVLKEFADTRTAITEVGESCRSDGAGECVYHLTIQ